jgi:cytochrome P450
MVFTYRGILHDPRNYPNPEKFDPTRYLGEKPQLDPREVSFGFGRRWAFSLIFRCPP